MIALIGDLIVKACLAIGILILSAGAGVITYGGANKVKDIIQPSSSPSIKSEFEESWVTPTPVLSPKPAVEGEYVIPTPDSDPLVSCRSKSGNIVTVKSSVCKTYVDCQLGNDWFPMPKDKCKELQSTNRTGGWEDPRINCQVYGTAILTIPEECERMKKTEQEIDASFESTEASPPPATSDSASTPEATEATPPDYRAYCQEELRAHEQNALAVYGGSSSTFFGIQQVLHDSCYPRCLSTGSWPSDCGVPAPNPDPSPSYEGTEGW